MRYLTLPTIVLVTGLLLAAPPKVVEEFSGKVIGVTDGDTIKVLVNKESVTVRLEGIDAPESGQSYGKKSKEALAEIVAGKTVTVKKTGTDKYKRTLGIVMVGDADANAKMVEDGWAWHFKKYNDEERLAKLEDAARKAKRGLWADETPLAPWEYRARQKTPEANEAAPKSLYWLNTSSGVRHNQRCEHFQKTKKGRFCGADEGKPCGICGG
jgi:endonuclease YncB( thermonuclease family)